jgi:hypothetical protein
LGQTSKQEVDMNKAGRIREPLVEYLIRAIKVENQSKQKLSVSDKTAKLNPKNTLGSRKQRNEILIIALMMGLVYLFGG